MKISNYCGKNGQKVELGELTLYFSEETLLAFEHPDAGLVIRENEWGPAEGKRLNAIDNDHRKRIPGYAFQQNWEHFAEHYGINHDFKIGV